MKIFVTNLPPDLDETAIATLFITYGDISTINLVMDRETGRSRGFAFIEMPNDEEALNAISHLDQKMIGHNRQLSVSQAQERPRPTGGSFDRSNNNRKGSYHRNGNSSYDKNRGNSGDYNNNRGFKGNDQNTRSSYDRNSAGNNTEG